MKGLNLILYFGLLSLFISAVFAEWSLTDNFNGNALNSTVWNVDKSQNNTVLVQGGELVLNAQPDTFAHIELNNSWDNLEVQAKFKVNDTNSGSGKWAPGMFFYWGQGNWSSIQLDASERKIISYASVNGRIVMNESLNGLIFGEYYYLDMQLIPGTIYVDRHVRKRASLSEQGSYYDNISYDDGCRSFQGVPKLIILGKGFDNGSEEYLGPDLDAGSLGVGNFSSINIDDFRVRFGRYWGTDTAKYLIGKVHIAVLFVSRYNITYPEDVKSSVMTKTSLAGQYLAEMAPQAANLNFSYSYYNTYIVNESVRLCEDECLDAKPSWCGTWMEDAIKNAGFSDFNNNSYYPDDMGADVKDASGADQSVLLFSVYSEDDYPTCMRKAFANPNNWAVITTYKYSNDPYYDHSYPHEILHAFGAEDEYDADRCYSCNYSSSADFFYPNGNCITCDNTVPCIMKADDKSMCNYTRGQIGWGDHDGDGILDSLDPEMFSPVSSVTSTTTSTTTTTLTCYSTPSLNLSEGENNIVFESPHNYQNNMNCYSTTYNCPDGYFGSIHVKYDTEKDYDYLYVYNDYIGTSSRLSGNSTSYTWIPVPNQNRTSYDFINTTRIRMRFVSDEALNYWGAKVDKISCSKDNPGVSLICPVTGDQAPCGRITLRKVVSAINMWGRGLLELNDVMLLIEMWKL